MKLFQVTEEEEKELVKDKTLSALSLLYRGSQVIPQAHENLSLIIPNLNENTLPCFLHLLLNVEKNNMTSKADLSSSARREVMSVLVETLEVHQEKAVKYLTKIIQYILNQLKLSAYDKKRVTSSLNATVNSSSGNTEKTQRKCAESISIIASIFPPPTYSLSLHFIKPLFQLFGKRFDLAINYRLLHCGIALCFQKLFSNPSISSYLQASKAQASGESQDSDNNNTIKMQEKEESPEDQTLLLQKILRKLIFFLSNRTKYSQSAIYQILITLLDLIPLNLLVVILPELITRSIQSLSQQSSPYTQTNNIQIIHWEDRLHAASLLNYLATKLPPSISLPYSSEIIHYLAQCRYDKMKPVRSEVACAQKNWEYLVNQFNDQKKKPAVKPTATMKFSASPSPSSPLPSHSSSKSSLPSKPRNFPAHSPQISHSTPSPPSNNTNFNSPSNNVNNNNNNFVANGSDNRKRRSIGRNNSENLKSFITQSRKQLSNSPEISIQLFVPNQPHKQSPSHSFQFYNSDDHHTKNIHIDQSNYDDGDDDGNYQSDDFLENEIYNNNNNLLERNQKRYANNNNNNNDLSNKSYSKEVSHGKGDRSLRQIDPQKTKSVLKDLQRNFELDDEENDMNDNDEDDSGDGDDDEVTFGVDQSNSRNKLYNIKNKLTKKQKSYKEEEDESDDENTFDHIKKATKSPKFNQRNFIDKSPKTKPSHSSLSSIPSPSPLSHSLNPLGKNVSPLIASLAPPSSILSPNLHIQSPYLSPSSSLPHPPSSPYSTPRSHLNPPLNSSLLSSNLSLHSNYFTNTNNNLNNNNNNNNDNINNNNNIKYDSSNINDLNNNLNNLNNINNTKKSNKEREEGIEKMEKINTALLSNIELLNKQIFELNQKQQSIEHQLISSPPPVYTPPKATTNFDNNNNNNYNDDNNMIEIVKNNASDLRRLDEGIHCEKSDVVNMNNENNSIHSENVVSYNHNNNNNLPHIENINNNNNNNDNNNNNSIDNINNIDDKNNNIDNKFVSEKEVKENRLKEEVEDKLELQFQNMMTEEEFDQFRNQSDWEIDQLREFLTKLLNCGSAPQLLSFLKHIDRQDLTAIIETLNQSSFLLLFNFVIRLLASNEEKELCFELIEILLLCFTPLNEIQTKLLISIFSQVKK